MCRLHLVGQDILLVVEVCHLGVCLCPWVGESLAVILVPYVVVRPFCEVRCAILIAQHAVLGVRHEPSFLLGEPLLEVGCGENLLALLAVEYVEIISLGFVDTLIVYLCEAVELFPQFLHLCGLLLVLYGCHLAQVAVHWVYGEDRDA